jgi:hypothetical protein
LNREEHSQAQKGEQMTISQRLLNKWRKESLLQLEEIESGSTKIIDKIGSTKDLNLRILRLTQELIDQHLIKEVKSDS